MRTKAFNGVFFTSNPRPARYRFPIPRFGVIEARYGYPQERVLNWSGPYFT